jgi:uncharacterized surface protein with fasciclin (FAS1) repeats
MKKRWVKVSVILPLMILLSSLRMAGAATLSGQVKDYGTESGIPGVTVVAFANSTTELSRTLADANGSYKIDNLPSGTELRISFDRVGYVRRPTVQTCTLTAAGQTLDVLMVQEHAPVAYYHQLAARMAKNASAQAAKTALRQFGLPPEQLATVEAKIAELDGEGLGLSDPFRRAGVHSMPTVGGAAMHPSQDIMDNVITSSDHTTLVAAVRAAGWVDTLKSQGPFTIFAPTNEAFDKLPAGTVDGLIKSENKGLTLFLCNHVVPGKLDAKDLEARIKAGNGTASLTTVGGNTLRVTKKGGNFEVQDEQGHFAKVTVADVKQKNGVLYVIDSVLLLR